MKTLERTTDVGSYKLKMKIKTLSFKPRGTANQITMAYTSIAVPTDQKEAEYYG